MTDPRAPGPHLAIDAIVARYARRDATLGVVGLGYVGLPLCLAAAKAGFAVVGFDIDADKPAMLMGMNELRGFRRVAIDFDTRKVLFDLPETTRIGVRSM